MNKIYKFGFYALTVQNLITGSLSESKTKVIESDDLSAKNFLITWWECVSSGFYVTIACAIIAYFLLLLVSKQADALLSDKEHFEPAVVSGGDSEQDLLIELTRSTDSFCTAEFDGESFSTAFASKLGLGNEDLNGSRETDGGSQATPKDSCSKKSAMEILKKEIQESRQLREDLENNLGKILKENSGLAKDKVSWTDGLEDGIVNYHIDDGREKLKEKLAVEREERITKAALRDHNVIQQKLLTSQKEIKELQQQIEELKMEKQTAIELVNKILFRSNIKQNKRALSLKGVGSPPLDDDERTKIENSIDENWHSHSLGQSAAIVSDMEPEEGMKEKLKEETKEAIEDEMKDEIKEEMKEIYFSTDHVQFESRSCTETEQLSTKPRGIR